MRKFLTIDDAVVPMMHPRILVELATEQGGSLDVALYHSEIPPSALESPEARISYRQFAWLVHNALRMTGDPALGIEVGRRVHLKNLGMLGVLIMNARTIGEALDAALSYHHALAPAVEFELLRTQSRVTLRCHPTISLDPYLIFAMEMLLGVLDNSARALVSPDFRAEVVRVGYDRPAHAERYAVFEAAELQFGCTHTEIVWPAGVLDNPITASDPIMAELARRECDAQVAPFMRGLLAQIRTQLHARPGHYPGMPEVASALQTSQRSLRRHLADMDTTYNDLVDEARRRHAEQAVRDTTLPLERIADMLGYGDVRSFRRAWVRWTGTTPGAYRRALAERVG